MGEEDADYSIKIMNMIKMYGEPDKVNKASANEKNMDVGANLFVGNLDAEVEEKLLFDTFSAFGVILQVPKIIRDTDTGNSKGFAFVNFASFEASDLALKAMNGQYLCNRPITCSYAFKKDTKGKRHVFSDIPGLRPVSMAPPMPPMMEIGALGGMAPPQMQGMQHSSPGMQTMQQGMQGMPGMYAVLQMPTMQMPGKGIVQPSMRPPQYVSGMFPPPPPMSTKDFNSASSSTAASYCNYGPDGRLIFHTAVDFAPPPPPPSMMSVFRKAVVSPFLLLTDGIHKSFAWAEEQHISHIARTASLVLFLAC
uniref:Splicing factor 3B subunit 4 n=1 Tax=Ditylenchus dipsaci TaxID=166011 RepID=A0A915DWW6_9BILA